MGIVLKKHLDQDCPMFVDMENINLFDIKVHIRRHICANALSPVGYERIIETSVTT